MKRSNPFTDLDQMSQRPLPRNRAAATAARKRAMQIRSVGGRNRRRNAQPLNEWDFEDIVDEGERLGSQQARALGHERRQARKEPKRYHVTWYSPLKGKRTGFVQAIEADSQAAAKKQAKAMITNDPKASNFIAKEAKRNPTQQAKTSARFPGWRLGDEVRSKDPKDAKQPNGFIFSWQDGNKVRVYFNDNSIRDVSISMLAKRNPHGSHSRMVVARTRAGGAVTRKASAEYKRGAKLEAQGKTSEAIAAYKNANKLLTRGARSGEHSEGPVGRLPNPNYSEVSFYIQKIRNKDKKRYAAAYWRWIQAGEIEPSPDRGSLSFMGAQAVRSMLYGFKDKAERTSNPSTGGRGAGATSSDVRSPTRTSTEVRSPTKTSTWAKTEGNITVTGGAGAGANTTVVIKRKPNPTTYAIETLNKTDRNARWQYLHDRSGNVSEFKTEAAAQRIARKINKQYQVRILSQESPLSPIDVRRKRNPSTREMSERFTGRASGRVTELKASNRAPGDLSRAGKLVFLKLTDSKAQLKIPGAVVCIDPKTEKLWIAGNRSPLLNRKANPGEALDHGEIEKICYETAKAHIGGGRMTEYVHTFGENGGRKPRLHVDAEGMPVIVGGDYKIKAEGIVN